MSTGKYLVNSARIVSCKINQREYVDVFKSFTVSDSSAFKNGIITTTGTVVIGQELVGGADITSYTNNAFSRGDEVELRLKAPGEFGGLFRHPRGLLYVIGNSYSPETEELTVEVGCKLALMQLTDSYQDILQFCPQELDPTQESFQNIGAVLYMYGKYIYQDNNGIIKDEDCFPQGGGVPTSLFVSELGRTALSVAPAAGSASKGAPDTVKVTYQMKSEIPVEEEDVDPEEPEEERDLTGFVETVEDLSHYWINFPVTSYSLQLPEGEDLGEEQETDPAPETVEAAPEESECGNAPEDPTDQEEDSCEGTFVANRQPLYIPASRVSLTTTTYGGPAAQVSEVKSRVEGPAYEANPQYFADQYAYCKGVYASKCNPNGSCPIGGMDRITLGEVVTKNTYGEGNELIETSTDSYEPLLSAMIPDDWRSTNENGETISFNNTVEIDGRILYRASRVTTQYYRSENLNVQYTRTWTSIASRGGGVGGGRSGGLNIPGAVMEMDALMGIETSNFRKSTTTAVLEESPDRLNRPDTVVDAEVEEFEAITEDGYLNKDIGLNGSTSLDGIDEYVLEESMPLPLSEVTSKEKAKEIAGEYAEYIVKWIKGDYRAIQVAESLTVNISGWKPTSGFRYWDPILNAGYAYMMDQASWAVTQSEAIFACTGIYFGSSNGVVSAGANVIGAIKPDMSADQTAGTGPAEPVVELEWVGETVVNTGPYIQVVNVDFGFESTVDTYGRDGVTLIPPQDGDLEYDVPFSFAARVSGIIVGPGQLLETSVNGSVPVDAAGSLVTDTAVVVDPKVFGAAAP